VRCIAPAARKKRGPGCSLWAQSRTARTEHKDTKEEKTQSFWAQRHGDTEAQSFFYIFLCVFVSLCLVCCPRSILRSKRTNKQRGGGPGEGFHLRKNCPGSNTRVSGWVSLRVAGRHRRKLPNHQTWKTDSVWVLKTVTEQGLPRPSALKPEPLHE
jgi:hypothetical protein